LPLPTGVAIVLLTGIIVLLCVRDEFV